MESDNILAQAVLVLVPMILCLTVHEYAHALAARWLGDDTAKARGRLTLNPLSHLDPIGTVLLPMLILLANGALAGSGRVPFFGWAKPVPVNPLQFRRSVGPRRGMMITAAAGPLSNLVLAFGCAAALSLAQHHGMLGSIPASMRQLLVTMVNINIALFVFNMVPIYPLDGQKVLGGLLKGEKAMRFERFSMQYGSLLLMLLIFFAQEVISLPYRMLYTGVLTVVGLG